MHVRFLLGPAGSGKTFRCLEEIRAELIRDPQGPPLLLLAPKQATFQLERQLLADGSLCGYTRLQILSFDRLAQFILSELSPVHFDWLDDEGRVMVLRALLAQKRSELRLFHATARLPGFATRLSLLLRELQRHQISPDRLLALAKKVTAPAQLRNKLYDFALLLQSYLDWLQEHQLRDADSVLDEATAVLRAPSQPSTLNPQLRLAGLWLDGFAEMTPQELDLLTALVPFCDCATLAFCLEREPQNELSWLSTWNVVAQTVRRCHAKLKAIEGCNVAIETLANKPGQGRFATSEPLRNLEACWSQTTQHSTLNTQHPAAAIRLVQCSNSENEAVLAAREILRHVRAGGRFRDCAVIVRQLEPYHAVLNRVFQRYEIPFFMDRRESVSHHPLAELTRFAFRTVTFNWRHDDWFGVLKSGLVPVREDETDVLENEALARGWQGKTWREPFTIAKDEAHASRLEKLRHKLVPPFEKFSAALSEIESSTAPNGKHLAAAIRELWNTLDVGEKLENWNAVASEQSEAGHRQAAIHTTVWEQMQSWLENLELAFANDAIPLRDWLPIIEAGLANLTVGVVPPALDQVLVGAIDRSRNPDLKLALVLGLNEGVFPEPPESSALLTDTDRSSLEKQNVYLGPTMYQRLGHERYLGYIACTRASQRLLLTCAAQDSDGQPLNPSPFFDHVKRITGVADEKFNGSNDWWESEHVCEFAPHALRTKISPELLQISAIAPVVKKWKQIQQAATVDRLSAAIVERIFGRELKSSVSGLEEFAACPFKFFAARGLRLDERKEFQFDDRDKGSFQHEVLSEFHRRVIESGRQWRDLTPAEAAELAANIGRELLPVFGDGKFLADGASKFTGEIMIERLRRLVSTLIEWMPQYEFNPAVCEIAFDSEKGELPSWRLDLEGGRALLLRGRIDRVDLCKVDDNTALAVVMDYKSRIRKLDATKLHHGLELQLLSYLGVLKHLRSPESIFGVKQLAPAGVFYVPLNGSSKPGASRGNVLAASNDEQRAEYQHSGRFLADELKHFDNRNLSKGDQFKYSKNKDSSFSVRGNDAMPAAEFEALREKIETHLRDYGRRIFAGEVTVSPFRIGQTTACDYCEFRAVCRFDPWTQPFRHLHPPTKEAAKKKGLPT